MFKKITFKEYQEIDAINQSSAKHILKSYKAYQYAKANEREPTKEMIFGRNVHLAILEPEIFQTKKIIVPKVRSNSLEGKKIQAEKAFMGDDAIIIDEETNTQIQKMIDEVCSHPFAKELLTTSEKEITGVTNFDGLNLKSMFDGIGINDHFIFDYKTTRSLESFQGQIWNKDTAYILQAMWYKNVFKSIHGIDPKFYFIAQEKTAPYEVQVFSLDETSIDKGQIIFQSVIDKLKLGPSLVEQDQQLRFTTPPLWITNEYPEIYLGG